MPCWAKRDDHGPPSHRSNYLNWKNNSNRANICRGRNALRWPVVCIYPKHRRVIYHGYKIFSTTTSVGFGSVSWRHAWMKFNFLLQLKNNEAHTHILTAPESFTRTLSTHIRHSTSSKQEHFENLCGNRRKTEETWLFVCAPFFAIVSFRCVANINRL